MTKTILKATAWFVANLTWNAFIALCVAVAVFAILDPTVAHEAAPIGGVELAPVSDNAMWFSLGFGFAGGWLVSWTCGWAAVFEILPFTIFAVWIVS